VVYTLDNIVTEAHIGRRAKNHNLHASVTQHAHVRLMTASQL
jgi:hypothetical protein